MQFSDHSLDSLFSESLKQNFYVDSDDIFASKLLPIFGSGRFPILFEESNLSETEREGLLLEIFALQPSLTLSWCESWNHFIHEAYGIFVPKTLSGVCCKPVDPSSCKALKRWACGGCGKVWLPGSLDYTKYPSCKPIDPPWWAQYLDCKTILLENGGPQEKPLVWVGGNLIRLGK